jgi:hypothetical protein
MIFGTPSVYIGRQYSHTTLRFAFRKNLNSFDVTFTERKLKDSSRYDASKYKNLCAVSVAAALHVVGYAGCDRNTKTTNR